MMVVQFGERRGSAKSSRKKSIWDDRQGAYHCMTQEIEPSKCLIKDFGLYSAANQKPLKLLGQGVEKQSYISEAKSG